MKQQINQNIQPVVYNNENFPLTFAYVISQSSILNANQSSSNYIENINYCLPKGLNIAIDGPSTVVPKTVLSMARTGNMVTVTSTAHGLSTGSVVNVSGATPSAYNGSFVITVTGTNTFTYTTSSSATDTATGTILLGAVTKTTSIVAVDPNRLVWITGKGAYITKEGAWVPVPEVTNLLNNSTKIYTTDKKGSYLVFDMTNIADPFNQIKQLETNEGYIVISNKAGQIPDYLWYETLAQNSNNVNRPIASFIYNQYNTNIIVNNNQKVVKLSDIEGVCDSHRKAGATVKVKLEDLSVGYHYKLKFTTNDKIIFENDELYYGNNKLKSIVINNNIDIISDLINNIVTINLQLYENDTLVYSDSLSIYVNCPPAPVQNNPPLVKPRFYLIGD